VSRLFYILITHNRINEKLHADEVLFSLTRISARSKELVRFALLCHEHDWERSSFVMMMMCTPVPGTLATVVRSMVVVLGLLVPGTTSSCILLLPYGTVLVVG